MSERNDTRNDLHYLQLKDFAGDKIIIVLENVCYLRVDNEDVKILFKGDPDEHIIKFVDKKDIERLNRKRF